MVRPNPEVINALLDARGLSRRDAAERIGVSESDLNGQLSSEKGPTERVIKGLSSELVVPAFVLFMSHAPQFADTLVDFRNTNPRRTPLSRSTIEAIDVARAIQKVAIENQHVDSLDRSLTVETLPGAAGRIRRSLAVSLEAQKEAKDSREFYGNLRRAIESVGVFVLHDSFPEEDGSGFCIADSPSVVIVVNTKSQTIERRIFTLIHELGHALIRATGISDPFVTKNKIERACNLFAARFLMPVEFMRESAERYNIADRPSNRDIYLLSRYLKVSQEATIIRLEQLRIAASGSHASWLESVREIGNPDRATKKGGPTNTPQEKIKLSRYGITFARVFKAALERGSLTPIDVYRVSGLKPKFQAPYFSYAETQGSDYDLI